MNPYEDGTREYDAWHQGYEGRTFFSTNDALNAIYDAGRCAAVSDVCKGTITETKRELRDGRMEYVLYVNNREVFHSMIAAVVDGLKKKLDSALMG
jgi:hypothetical protein